MDKGAYCKRGGDDNSEGTNKSSKHSSSSTMPYTVQFRASSVSEAERWVRLLNEWKDYFLMQVVDV